MNFSDAVRRMGEMSLLIGASLDDQLVCADLDETAHLFVSGATGTGKSVFVESILLSLILRNKPEQLKLILFDSKMVELSRYAGISHLVIPVITDSERLRMTLAWAEYETMKRLKKFSTMGMRSIDQYNELSKSPHYPVGCQALPRMLIVVDDLTTAINDLPEIADNIIDILMKGRAAGIHLLLVTQSVSAKAVKQIAEIVPSKTVFLTLTERESRFLLRNTKACQLEAYGDAIFSPTIGRSVHIKTIMAKETLADMIINIGAKNSAGYSDDIMTEVEKHSRQRRSIPDEPSNIVDFAHDNAEAVSKAIDALMRTGNATVSMLQKELVCGYSYAARLMDAMEAMGVVGPFEGSKPRRILLTRSQLIKLKGGN